MSENMSVRVNTEKCRPVTEGIGVDGAQSWKSYLRLMNTIQFTFSGAENR